MSVGERPAFPSGFSDTHYTPSGMTYRQWLIGMALQGVIAAELHVEKRTSGHFTDKTASSKVAAEHAIKAADAVIEQLDQENKP